MMPSSSARMMYPRLEDTSVNGERRSPARLASVPYPSARTSITAIS